MIPTESVKEGNPSLENNLSKVHDTSCQNMKQSRRPSTTALLLKNDNIRFMFSEFLGTFILMALGDGGVAQFLLSSKESFHRGSIVQLALCYGLATTVAIWSCFGCSGGHINPAFTVAAALYGRLPWRRVPAYFIGQYLGAFCGALAVFIVYQSGFNNYESQCDPYVYRPVGTNCSTAGVFATYASLHVADWQAFIDQVFVTGYLILAVFAITDPKNLGAPTWAMPPMVGAVVVALVLGYEYNTGAALNPARDFGPRVFTAMAGWGMEVFRYPTSTYWLVPIFGPHIGAILGAGLYTGCVGMHLPEKKEPKPQIHREADEIELKPSQTDKILRQV